MPAHKEAPATGHKTTGALEQTRERRREEEERKLRAEWERAKTEEKLARKRAQEIERQLELELKGQGRGREREREADEDDKAPDGKREGSTSDSGRTASKKSKKKKKKRTASFCDKMGSLIDHVEEALEDFRAGGPSRPHASVPASTAVAASARRRSRSRHSSAAVEPLGPTMSGAMPVAAAAGGQRRRASGSVPVGDGPRGRKRDSDASAAAPTAAAPAAVAAHETRMRPHKTLPRAPVATDVAAVPAAIATTSTAAPAPAPRPPSAPPAASYGKSGEGRTHTNTHSKTKRGSDIRPPPSKSHVDARQHDPLRDAAPVKAGASTPTPAPALANKKTDEEIFRELSAAIDAFHQNSRGSAAVPPPVTVPYNPKDFGPGIGVPGSGFKGLQNMGPHHPPAPGGGTRDWGLPTAWAAYHPGTAAVSYPRLRDSASECSFETSTSPASSGSGGDARAGKGKGKGKGKGTQKRQQQQQQQPPGTPIPEAVPGCGANEPGGLFPAWATVRPRPSIIAPDVVLPGTRPDNNDDDESIGPVGSAVSHNDSLFLVPRQVTTADGDTHFLPGDVYERNVRPGHDDPLADIDRSNSLFLPKTTARKLVRRSFFTADDDEGGGLGTTGAGDAGGDDGGADAAREEGEAWNRVVMAEQVVMRAGGDAALVPSGSVKETLGLKPLRRARGRHNFYGDKETLCYVGESCLERSDSTTVRIGKPSWVEDTASSEDEDSGYDDVLIDSGPSSPREGRDRLRLPSYVQNPGMEPAEPWLSSARGSESGFELMDEATRARWLHATGRQAPAPAPLLMAAAMALMKETGVTGGGGDAPRRADVVSAPAPQPQQGQLRLRHEFSWTAGDDRRPLSVGRPPLSAVERGREREAATLFERRQRMARRAQRSSGSPRAALPAHLPFIRTQMQTQTRPQHFVGRRGSVRKAAGKGKGKGADKPGARRRRRRVEEACKQM